MSPRRPCNLPLSFPQTALADGPCLRGCNSYDYVITSCGSVSFFFFLVKLVLSGDVWYRPRWKKFADKLLFQAVLSVNWSFSWWLFLYDKHISVYFVQLVFRFWDLKHSFWLRIHMPGKLSNLESYETQTHFEVHPYVTGSTIWGMSYWLANERHSCHFRALAWGGSNYAECWWWAWAAGI